MPKNTKETSSALVSQAKFLMDSYPGKVAEKLETPYHDVLLSSDPADQEQKIEALRKAIKSVQSAIGEYIEKQEQIKVQPMLLSKNSEAALEREVALIHKAEALMEKYPSIANRLDGAYRALAFISDTTSKEQKIRALKNAIESVQPEIEALDISKQKDQRIETLAQLKASASRLITQAKKLGDNLTEHQATISSYLQTALVNNNVNNITRYSEELDALLNAKSSSALRM